MAVVLVTNTQHWIGTAAERAAMVTTGIKAGSTFEEDSGTVYKWNGVAWFVSENPKGLPSSASRTRPDNVTAYAANDVVGADPATNLVFTNVFPISGASIIINRVELRIDVATVPAGMAGFKLHIYDSSPTAIADNAAFNIPSADRAKYLGFIDIDTPVDYGDTLYVDMKGVNFQCKLATASTTLYGMIVTNAAYTPTALASKTVKIHSLGV